MPNNISKFWQELKRRKVIRTITVYAAAAFVILELTDIVAPSLGLPGWTLNFIIVLLSVGFIIAVILSWIYDIHPDGGVVKTEPVHKVKKEDISKSSNSWKIAGYISFVVIVGLIALNIIPRFTRGNKFGNLEKSIAVLPLEYLSEDPDREYLANGVLDAITGHLSLIEGLRVMPRTSVEQYRETQKTAKQIGEELDVSYLVEGSFLMVDNRVKLTIQLVVAEIGDHIFFKEYTRDYSDIITVQSEVAQTIAKEIEVVITPEEIQNIERIPTANLTAYDFYQRGNEEHWKYRTDLYNLKALDKAEEQYNKALSYDSTFGQAYLGLAEIYMDRNIATEYLLENYLDSALELINKALMYDNTLADAYVLRGDYYRENGYDALALDEYNRALEINPNSWESYRRKAELNYGLDLVAAIDNLHKAISLYRGRELPELLGALAFRYRCAGFSEIGRKYAQEKLNLDNDSISFFSRLALIESDKGNDEGEEKYARKVYTMDSTNMDNLQQLGYLYGLLVQHEKSLIFWEKWLDQLDNTYVRHQRFNAMHRVGYAYWKNELYEKAEYYFDLQMENCNRIIELDLPPAQNGAAYYDRAAVYAFRGERDKALEDLRTGLNQITGLPLWIITLIKRDPLFDSIRDEPEFQQLVSDAEAMYQAEHERVRQWLVENDML